MHRRHFNINIPTEIVRTVVVISETGSFSRAAEKLGLSQPGISAQVKRLQTLVGAPLFDKVSGGVTFTELGKIVLGQARRMLEANDQILALAGSLSESLPVRLGISNLYVERYLEACKGAPQSVHIHCDQSGKIRSGLAEGYIDVACIMNVQDCAGSVVETWHERYKWIRSESFLLNPDAPIPLITWPAHASDQLVIQALQKKGIAYKLAFVSSEHRARIAAATAGVGLLTNPTRYAIKPLVVAHENFLPPLPPIPAGIAIRHGVDMRRVEPVIAQLRAMVKTLVQDSEVESIS
jgi:DNA-binding transcriptional LysR family regulator